jgi:hypothetical protein
MPQSSFVHSGSEWIVQETSRETSNPGTAVCTGFSHIISTFFFAVLLAGYRSNAEPKTPVRSRGKMNAAFPKPGSYLSTDGGYMETSKQKYFSHRSHNSRFN